MYKLLLLPFRGLLWLVLGCICSLPWLLVIMPLTMHDWLPKALAYWFEAKTHFPCRINDVRFDWRNGKVSLKNVSIYNPEFFHTSDMLKLQTIDCSIDFLSFFQNMIHIHELSIECRKIASVSKENKNNWNLLKACFLSGKFQSDKNSTSKGIWIETLKIEFNGIASAQNDGKTAAMLGIWLGQSVDFQNVCINVPVNLRRDLIESCSLQKIFSEIDGIFSDKIPSFCFPVL